MKRTRQQRVRDGLYGLLVGDALGVPYEFHPPAAVPAANVIAMIPPEGFARSYPEIPPGTWSDDGAQALCLLDSLLAHGTLELTDFADRLLAWVNGGLWAVDNHVFDCGIQTMQALRAYAGGVPPWESGFVLPDGKGNGALMRTLPIALLGQEPEETVRQAHTQALVTHGHVCNQVCCALYCLWAAQLLEGYAVEEGYRFAAAYLQGYYASMPDYGLELERCLAQGQPAGTGYVVDSIRSARFLLRAHDSYEGVVKGAVGLGNDTDTTAAIAGGLAGIAYGGIPEKWLALLRGREMAEELLQKLDHI